MSVAKLSVEEFHALIADPDRFSGGGSVAATTAAGAAATALLVMRLNARRRTNASIRDQIEASIAATEAWIDAFHNAAQADITILNELLDAQREARDSGDRTRYLAALQHAAESPLEMAEMISELLGIVASQLPISTRFTVSDLGAAAALAEGACRAALLTAEVNIALLREANDADQEIAAALEQRRATVRAQVIEHATTIEATTRDVMLRAKSKTAKEQG